VIALAGSLGAGAEALYQMGIDALVPLPDGPLSLEDAMERAETLLADAAERAARLIAIGMLKPSGTSCRPGM
jgi:glycerate kinase